MSADTAESLVDVHTVTWTGSETPVRYRLARRRNGVLLLQGLFAEFGETRGLHTIQRQKWRDLPTVELP